MYGPTASRVRCASGSKTVDLSHVTGAIMGIRGMATGGTFSVTPLAWNYVQCVRLAWSIYAGHPVEQRSIFAERYAGAASSPLATVWPEGNLASGTADSPATLLRYENQRV